MSLDGGDPDAAAAWHATDRRADRARHRRRCGQRPGPRRDRHRRADRHLRPPRRPVAAAEHLLPVPRARRRHRRLERARRRHGRGDRGPGRGRRRPRRRNSYRRRRLRRRPGRRGALPQSATTSTCIRGRFVLAGVTPAVLAEPARRTAPRLAPGAQVKVNMVLRRLPRLRDERVTPEQAFAGTFHVNETWTQLDTAYSQAAAGRASGSVTVRGLLPFADRPEHPVGRAARLGRADDDGVRPAHTALAGRTPTPDASRLTESVLASLNSVLAEPIQDVLLDRRARAAVHRDDDHRWTCSAHCG